MKWYDVIIWILFLLSLAIALWYLFGSLPTFEQAILVFMLTVLFTIAVKVSEIKTELAFLKHRFNNLEKSFIKLVEDFKLIKKRK